MHSEAKTVLQSPESDGQSRPSQDVDQRSDNSRVPSAHETEAYLD
jgi:hypothetical protein